MMMCTLAIAQQPQQQQPAANSEGFMYGSSRIYVVVAVVVTILTGLFIYVWMLDRKISKSEKNSG
jgi:flagellar basal body-associated protein FliL